jgi:acetyl esterase/lipase
MLDDRPRGSTPPVDLPVWSRTSNAFAWGAYLGDRVGGPDVPPYAAPSRAEDLTGLPPAYIVVGGLDGFLAESIDYAGRLAHAGVPTDLRVYPGLPHGFDGIAPGAAACKRASRDLNEWLSRAIEVRVPGHERTGHGTLG